MNSDTKRRREGAATVEAVILLPVLALLLGGLTFLGRAYEARAQAQSLARQCAFQHAMAGCPDAVPEGCEDSLRVALLDDATSTESGDALRGMGRSEAGDDGIVSGLSILDRAIGTLIGTVVSADVEREVPWSPVMNARAHASAKDDDAAAGRSTTVRGNFAVLCNATPIDPLKDVKRLLSDFLGLGD